jgi:hypothetical protein
MIAHSSSPKTRSPNHLTKHDRPTPKKNTIAQPPTKKRDRPITPSKNMIAQSPTKTRSPTHPQKHDRPLIHKNTIAQLLTKNAIT